MSIESCEELSGDPDLSLPTVGKVFTAQMRVWDRTLPLSDTCSVRSNQTRQQRTKAWD